MSAWPSAPSCNFACASAVRLGLPFKLTTDSGGMTPRQSPAFTLTFMRLPSITTCTRPCVSLSAPCVLFVSVLCYRFVLIRLILCCLIGQSRLCSIPVVFSFRTFPSFVLSFTLYPTVLIHCPHAVASNQRQPSSAPTSADLLALVSTTPIRSLHIPTCHPENPYDTIYDPGFGYAYKDSLKGFIRTAPMRILPPSNSKSLFFGPIPCFSLSFSTTRSLQIQSDLPSRCLRPSTATKF